jgi:threonine synthase
MSEVLGKIIIEGRDYWALIDTSKRQIIQQIDPVQMAADIKSIDETLKQYPSPAVEQTTLNNIIYVIDQFTGATKAQKDAAKALLVRMWQAYENDSTMMDAAELLAKRARLVALLAEMEV